MNDTFGEYLDRIGAIPLLTKADEQRLGRLIMEGQEAAEKLKSDPDNRALRRAVRAGERAKEEMIVANLRLVVSTVRKQFGTSKVEMEDLIGFGNKGLIRAVEKFDYRRGFKFSTYAVHWIRQAVGRGAISSNPGFKMSYTAVMKWRSILGVRSELENELGREVSAKEIAEHMGTTIEAVQEAMVWDNPLMSLDWCTEGDTPLHDLVGDPHADDPTDVAARPEAIALGQKALAVLGPKDRRLIEMRIGFGPYARREGNDTRGYGGMSQQEIAKALGMSLESVRQREHAILCRLRGHMPPEADLLVAS